MTMSEKDAYNEKDYIRYMCFYSGVDFGFLSLQNEKYPIKQAQSFSVRLNLMEYKKQLVENRFGVFSGISLGYQQIGFEDDFKFQKINDAVAMIPDSIDYLKNQLRSFSISVPLMLEMNSKNTFKNNVHLAVGAQFGYRYANSTYQKHLNGEATFIRKNSEDILVNPIQIESCIRVGYQNLTLFVSRSITPLFRANKFESEIYPLVIGISILPSNSKPHYSDDFDF